MPSSRFLLALALVAAAAQACTLPDYVYDDDAFARASQGGAGGAGGSSAGTAGAESAGGSGGKSGSAGHAGKSGSSGSSGHSGDGGTSSGKGGEGGTEAHGGSAGSTAGDGGSSGDGGSAGDGGMSGDGGSAGGSAGDGGSAGSSAGQSGSAGTSAGGSSAGTSGTGGTGGTTGGTSAGGTSAGGTSAGTSGTGGASGKGGSSGTGGTSGTSGTGGSAGTGGATSCTIKHYDFTGCNDGFLAATGKSKWQCGKPSVGPKGDHTSGPGAVWATRLDGKPQMCDDSTLESPALDLSKHAGKPVKLSFWSWNDFRGCDPNGDFGAGICKLECGLIKDSYSGGTLEVLVNGTWTVVTPTGGYGNSTSSQTLYVNGSTEDSNGNPKAPCQTSSLDGQKAFASSGPEQQWKQWTFDVSAYVSGDFHFRLHFASAPDEDFCFPNATGWFIDDLDLGYASPCP